VTTAALIPVKRFRDAKRRLAPLLDVDERAALARWLADRVIAAADGLHVFVACDDEGVAEWAESAGADVLWSPGLGLNGAVDAGRATVTGKGFDVVVTVHSDVPLAHDLAGLATPDTITIVPDRRRDGTNVLAAPAGARLAASYGAASFRSHLALALADRYRVEVRGDPRLALDVDRPDDLAHPALRKELPPWLRTILDNRR
jgi:2-phospho-L-lactate/phosphoenolpyruvate guanylyltransferase